MDDLQAHLSRYVGELVEHTTTRVTHSGLERLDKHSPYLFISNHRDIVFDPMVVNYLLFQNGFHTTRIAIGDNLLQNRVFAEMMRPEQELRGAPQPDQPSGNAGRLHDAVELH